jgi:hypothetical protein
VSLREPYGLRAGAVKLPHSCSYGRGSHTGNNPAAIPCHVPGKLRDVLRQAHRSDPAGGSRGPFVFLSHAVSPTGIGRGEERLAGGQ